MMMGSYGVKSTTKELKRCWLSQLVRLVVLKVWSKDPWGVPETLSEAL